MEESVLKEILEQAQEWERQEYGERRDDKPQPSDQRQGELF
jgi:hypothetical protein